MISEADHSEDELMDSPLVIDEEGFHGNSSMAFHEHSEPNTVQPVNFPVIKRTNNLNDHNYQTKPNPKTVIIALKNDNPTGVSNKLAGGVNIVNNQHLMEGCNRISLDMNKNRNGNVKKYIICLQKNPTNSSKKGISIISPPKTSASSCVHFEKKNSRTYAEQTTHINANDITGELQRNTVNLNTKNQMDVDARKNAHLKINNLIQSNNNILNVHQLGVKSGSRYVNIQPKPIGTVNINNIITSRQSAHLRKGSSTVGPQYTRSILNPGLVGNQGTEESLVAKSNTMIRNVPKQQELVGNQRNEEVPGNKSKRKTLCDFCLPVKVLPMHSTTCPIKLVQGLINSNTTKETNRPCKMRKVTDAEDQLHSTKTTKLVSMLNSVKTPLIGGISVPERDTNVDRVNSPGMLNIVNCVPEIDSEVNIITSNHIETLTVKHNVNKDNNNKVGTEFTVPHTFAVEKCVPEVFSEVDIVTTSTINTTIETGVATYDDSGGVRSAMLVGAHKTNINQTCVPGNNSKINSGIHLVSNSADVDMDVTSIENCSQDDKLEVDHRVGLCTNSISDDTGVIKTYEPRDKSEIVSEVELVTNCADGEIEIDIDEPVDGEVGPKLCDIKTEVLSENEDGACQANSPGDFDDSAPDIKAFLCQGCWIVFDNPRSLDEHVCPFKNTENSLDETGKRLFTCGHCGKKFNDRYLAKRHLKSHTGVKEFHCDICDKSFLLKHQLVNHIESHFETRPFHCQICSAAFKRKGHLFKHRLSHTSTRERKYRCTYCDMAFFMLDKLQRHEATHSLNRQRYVCDICHLQYTSLSALQRHIQRTHEAKYLARKMKKVLRCKYCDAGYFLRKQLTTHLTSHDIYVGPEENIQKYTRKATRQEREEFGKIMVNYKSQKKK